MSEGGSALSISASRTENEPRAPKGGMSAALGKFEGKAAGELSFPGETTVPLGEIFQIRGNH